MHILAIEIGDQLVQTVGFGLDAYAVEDFLDIVGAGGGVAGDSKKQVGCEMLHCGYLVSALGVSIDVLEVSIDVVLLDERYVCRLEY